MTEESGLWLWVQPHCRCGWIGVEQDRFETASIERALQELSEHQAKDHP